MRNTFRLGLTAGAAVVALATAGIAPAQAFMITSGGTLDGINGQKSSVGGVTNVTFDIPFPLSTTYTNSGISAPPITSNLVTGSLVNQYLTPTGDETRYLTLGGDKPGPVDIVLSSLNNYFGLYWGSIDAYNTVAFYKGSFTAANLVGSFAGDALGISGITANGTQSSYINFDSEGASQYFDRIRLTSTQAAFESDNHAFRAVPTPALLPGLVGIGVSLWRKRRQQAA
jgi:hypothetical protein